MNSWKKCDLIEIGTNPYPKHCPEASIKLKIRKSVIKWNFTPLHPQLVNLFSSLRFQERLQIYFSGIRVRESRSACTVKCLISGYGCLFQKIVTGNSSSCRTRFQKVLAAAWAAVAARESYLNSSDHPLLLIWRGVRPTGGPAAVAAALGTIWSKS